MTRVAPPQRSSSGSGGIFSLGSSKSSGNKQNIFLVLGGVLIVVFALMSSSSGSNKSSSTSTDSLATEGSKQAKTITKMETVDAKKEILLSSVSIPTIGDVPFYQCNASTSDSDSSSSSTTTHLMLLHGAKFTKEDWKRSGILEKFCNSNFKLAVSAMDLPVSAGHNDLKNLLNKMVEERRIEKLPVALITPSASGLTMSDWMKNGNIEEIPNYIFKWIPVASGSVKTVSPTQIESLKSLKKTDFGVFAIYGDQDKMGKTVTQYLHDHADAKTLELPGTHPVYLDSPDPFVQNVLEDLNLLGR